MNASARRFIDKIQLARTHGLLWRKSREFLARRLLREPRMQLRVMLGYLGMPASDRALSLSSGFSDHRAAPTHRASDPEHLRRIVAAYRLAKSEQGGATAPFQIRGMWAELIEHDFADLIAALEAADLPRLSRLLENLNREHFVVGLGGGYENYVRYQRWKMHRAYFLRVWCDYRDKLLAHGFDLSQVSFPMVGNPAGLPVNGSVIQIDTWRHAYHAVEMCDWLRGTQGAVIVEIGAGCGGQAYQAVRLGGSDLGKYVIFDIPEVAAISSYFLLTAFPEKRIRLYGEGPVSVAPSDPYDLAVFPHYAIDRLPARSVDLFYNSCSFSEMDSASSSEYLRIIERACRRYFAHENHEVTFHYVDRDGRRSTNRIGSRLVPNPADFKRVYKKPRVYNLPEDLRDHAVAFEYLYERLPDSGES